MTPLHVEILLDGDPVSWDRMDGGELVWEWPSRQNDWKGRVYRTPVWLYRGRLGLGKWREVRRVRAEDLTLTYEDAVT